MAVKRKTRKKATAKQLAALKKARAARVRNLRRAATKKTTRKATRKATRKTARKNPARKKVLRVSVKRPTRKKAARRTAAKRRVSPLASYAIQGIVPISGRYDYYYLKGNRFIRDLTKATKHRGRANCHKRMREVVGMLPSKISKIRCVKV